MVRCTGVISSVVSRCKTKEEIFRAGRSIMSMLKRRVMWKRLRFFLFFKFAFLVILTGSSTNSLQGLLAANTVK